MPIKSMTGFGIAEKKTPIGIFKVEIRSVNNRFFEMQAKLPKMLIEFEQKIKNEMSKYISRGSINLLVTCNKEIENNNLVLNKEACKKYVNILKEMQKILKNHEQITIKDLLYFSDIIKTDSSTKFQKDYYKYFSPVLINAINSLNISREKEGRFLSIQIKKMLNTIIGLIKKIELLAPRNVKNNYEEFYKRIQKLVQNNLDESRIATEAAIMADKIDITEECTRLKAHINAFFECFESKEAVGKRMNFILQEMNREANTLGSKVNNAQISLISVKIKEIIEKIREQIQNIE